MGSSSAVIFGYSVSGFVLFVPLDVCVIWQIYEYSI